jgi:hypothetical protein
VDNQLLKGDKFYIWGISLIILGYLISLMPYWWVFGTPLIFISGLILVWLSRKSKTTKILCTVLPIVLWLQGFWILIYFSSEHMTPETFLIPENFRGKITLYYGEPCGQELQKEDGRLIYNIPKNGVMIIKNPFETGFIDEEYYFVDLKGKIIRKIDSFEQQDFNETYTLEKNKHEPPRNKVAVFLGGTGGSGTVNGIDKEHYNFHELYVDSYDSLGAFNEMQVDSISMQALNGCRVKDKKSITSTSTPSVY